jgi:uncharacterized protein (DUF697 family)
MASLRPGAIYGVLKELREAASHTGPVCVTGALAAQLVKELGRGGAPGAVREGFVADAAALVHVLAADSSEEDERLLKRARRKRVPIVAVLAGPELDPRVPYVMATDVIRVPAGHGFPVEEIARALAGRLGEEGTSVAARLPVLRTPVCEHLIASFSRKNAFLAAAIFIPGADMPVLTLNQIRLVLRIANAHGVEVGQERLPEVLAVVGGGFAFRAVAQQALNLVPVAGWAVQGGIAYGATKAIGEAAIRYFAARSESVRPGT